MNIQDLISSFQNTINSGLGSTYLPTNASRNTETATIQAPKVKERDLMNDIGLAVKRR